MRNWESYFEFVQEEHEREQKLDCNKLRSSKIEPCAAICPFKASKKNYLLLDFQALG
jgi:hypothetical protein